MRIKSKTGRYGSLIRNGACATHGWQQGLRYSRGVRRWMMRSLGNANALQRLIAAHDRSLPYQLRAGHEVYTELDLGESGSDNDEEILYVQTSCGTHPSWERPKASRGIALHSYVAFPDEF